MCTNFWSSRSPVFTFSLFFWSFFRYVWLTAKLWKFTRSFRYLPYKSWATVREVSTIIPVKYGRSNWNYVQYLVPFIQKLCDWLVCRQNNSRTTLPIIKKLFISSKAAALLKIAYIRLKVVGRKSPPIIMKFGSDLYFAKRHLLAENGWLWYTYFGTSQTTFGRLMRYWYSRRRCYNG